INMDTDLEKAKEYVALCGDNTTFTVYCNNSPNYQLPCQVFQACLKEIGITCNIIELDSAGKSALMNWEGEYDMIYDSHDFRNWPSSNVECYQFESDRNLSHVANERILELIGLAAATEDVELRKQYYAEIQTINHDEVYYLTICCTSDNVAYRNGVSGFTVVPNGRHDFSYICMPAD
ncbi:MAG: hypothetical protein Q4C13_04085, partial [Clostridia bacterium]|nr:hypothetical protein [Clostridia bacterium]